MHVDDAPIYEGEWVDYGDWNRGTWSTDRERKRRGSASWRPRVTPTVRTGAER